MQRKLVKQRKSDYPIDSLFINRWSPRALSGESMSDEELFILFEAARWAPSSYNGQPWRFIYAKRETPAWQTIFDLMVPFNQSWAKNAAVLVVVISRNKFEFNGKPEKTHSYDTGAAWQNLSLQAHLSGIVAHGMEGFDYERAKKVLAIPDDYTVEAMIALGKPGNVKDLPAELQEKEVLSDRKTVKEIAFEGKFKGS